MNPTAAALDTRHGARHRDAQLDELNTAIADATAALIANQNTDGHWRFELEADCTIPAEYVLMMHFVDEVDEALEQRLGRFLRRQQGADGGWSLYYGGASDLSCTIKAYYALKIIGDDPAAEHMRRAREFVLGKGGAARANVFTRIALAQYAQVPWRSVPFMPVEVMLLPRWFPFHLSKVSYWSRTVMVPLFILYTRRVMARNPRGVGISELFKTDPHRERHYFHAWSWTNRIFLMLEGIGRRLEPLIPGVVRRRALARAEAWVVERLNGVDGLGAIFPAMVNAYEALITLGYGPEHPLRQDAKEALERLLVERDDDAYCQPCVSPVWDTVLSCIALQDTDEPGATEAVERGLDWLCARQVTAPIGDWRETRPEAPPGGWAFQYNNAHYPDLDDTAVVAWALARAERPDRYGAPLAASLDWLTAMQSDNGGFAAFDANNTYYYLNQIPFADHGALLDPPTEDVSARVLAAYGATRRPEDRAAAERCIDYLKAVQCPSGTWFGRWGTNYIYGTWSVLMALESIGADMGEPWIQQAVAWVKGCQRADGGWGETNESYEDPALAGQAPESTVHHTAWALLSLLAAGERDWAGTQRGIRWLLARQGHDGFWDEPHFNAPGFPRVFYLRYHGYPRFFPLWALARYRRALWNGHAPTMETMSARGARHPALVTGGLR